jgi:hypothetical protein
MHERYPVYGLADLTTHSREVPHDRIVDEIVDALAGHMAVVPEQQPADAATGGGP